MRKCEVRDLGRIGYAGAFALQRSLVERRKRGEIPDQLLLLEHPHTITLGRNGRMENLLAGEAAVRAAGIVFHETDRGGDITYHGPGQIVGYPIVSLERRKDLHAYLRFLEQVVINAVGSLGLAASRREGKTGIWLGRRKVTAIGVAVRRWVAYHGFALNVNNDLAHFGGIVPCGIAADEGTVTSLQAELGRALDPAEVRRVLANAFWRHHAEFFAREPESQRKA